MNCTFCQTPIPDTADRCPRCGLHLRETDPGYLDGVRAFADRNYPGALRKWQRALLAEPQSAELFASCGHALLHSGDPEGAEDYYNRAAKIRPSTPEERYNLALIAIQRGDRVRAAELLQAVTANVPKIRAGRYYLGLLFNDKNEFLCEVEQRLSKVLRELGDLHGARASAKRAVEHFPESVSARQNAAELALMAKQFREAIAQLEMVLRHGRLEEDRLDAHNNLAIALYEVGDIDGAIAHLKQVLEAAPGNPTAIHNLNHIYERQGIFDAPGSTAHAIRFMDMHEGALPIFGLTAEQTEDSGGVVMVGKSAEMLRVLRHARVAATSGSTVLIVGEQGTGKELLAKMIYLNSERSQAPYGTVHCSNVAEFLLESELFGHEKGAFTGAISRKVGRVGACEGGTVFLDEVGDLPSLLQIKLLRLLQEGEYTPMGGVPQKANVRVIAAATRDLAEVVATGKFREDLYYSLNVIPIVIPPLRDRTEDIPLLVEHFSRRVARKFPKLPPAPAIAREDLQVLIEYPWPGNVRELENLVERAMVMGRQSSYYLEEIKRMRAGARRQSKAADEPGRVSYPVMMSIAELERRHISAVLDATDHNQRAAARVLGINPSTLWRKLKQYGMENGTDTQGDA